MLISGLRRGTYSAIAQVPLSDPKVLLLVPPMSDDAALPVQLRSISLRISLRIPPLCADSCESALLAALINARATRPFGSTRPKSSQGRIPRSFVRFVFPVLLLCCGSGEQPRHPFGPLVRGVYLTGCERAGLWPSALCCRADGVKYRLTDNVCQQKL